MPVFRMLCRITVFRRAKNWVSVSDGSRTDNVSEFQSIGPETAKHLWPYLVVLESGTARSPRAAERRWPRLVDSDAGDHSPSSRPFLLWSVSLKYCWRCFSTMTGEPWYPPASAVANDRPIATRNLTLRRRNAHLAPNAHIILYRRCNMPAVLWFGHLYDVKRTPPSA